MKHLRRLQSLEESAAQRDTGRKETAKAQQREKDLQEQINQLLRELDKTEGEWAALRASKPKGFWARLLGGAISN